MSTNAECIPFDRAAGYYEATRVIPPHVVARAIGLVADDHARDRSRPFLDAGVGTGRFGRHLHRAGMTTVGVDISVSMIAEARRLSPTLRAVRADLRSLPFADGTFGGALMVHVLHLIAAWKDAITEVRRTLTPGAALFIGSEGGRKFPTYRTYFDVATELGLMHERLGAASVDAVIEHLTETGALAERIDGGRLTWMASQRRDDLIRALRLNPFSDLWHVEPEQHARVVAETIDRIGRQGADADEHETAEACLLFWRVTWPS